MAQTFGHGWCSFRRRSFAPIVVAIAVTAGVLVPTGARADSRVSPPLNTAALDGAAFAAAVGLLRVNVAAGAGNAQSNLVELSVGHVASDALLSNVASQSPSPVVTGLTARNHVGLAPGIFAGASGIVQVNATAGNGNASANAFTLRVRP